MNFLKISKTIVFQSEGNDNILDLTRDNIINILPDNFSKNANIVGHKISFTQSLFPVPLQGPLKCISRGEIDVEKSNKVYKLSYLLSYQLFFYLYSFIALAALFWAIVNGLARQDVLYGVIGILVVFIIGAGFSSFSDISFSNLMLKAIKKSGGKIIN